MPVATMRSRTRHDDTIVTFLSGIKVARPIDGNLKLLQWPAMDSRRFPAVPLLLLAATSASARADSLSSLPDPLYAYRDPGQPEPIAAHVQSIVYPTMGLPALVGFGGELDVFVRVDSAL
jgi:hypothetical protein